MTSVTFTAQEAAVILWRLEEREAVDAVLAFSLHELLAAIGLAGRYAAGEVVLPTRKERPDLPVVIAMACIAVIEGRPRQLQRERMLGTGRLPAALRSTGLR